MAVVDAVVVPAWGNCVRGVCVVGVSTGGVDSVGLVPASSCFVAAAVAMDVAVGDVGAVAPGDGSDADAGFVLADAVLPRGAGSQPVDVTRMISFSVQP